MMLHVVHLEDSLRDARLVRHALSQLDQACAISRVDTRDQFLEICQTRAIDMILADYSLPAFDGFSALRIAQEVCPHVPFIFVSGAIGEERAIEALKLGATDYVLKNHLERIVPSVQRALREVGDQKARQQAVEALIDSERRSNATFEQAAVGMAELAADGRWMRVNRKLCSILGVDRTELSSRRWRDFTHPDDLEEEERMIAEALRGRAAGYAMQRRSIRTDGSIVWVNLSCSLVRSAATGGSYFIAAVEDVTARKQGEEEVKAAREAAETANRSKDHFLAMLSHELRTPLAPVLLITEMLKQDSRIPCDVREEIERIRQSIALEVRLIDDLLDITRIERGKIELQLSTVDAVESVRQALRLLEHDALEKKLRVTVHLQGEPVFVLADSARLQQVFCNVLRNAIKFTPVGGAVMIRAARNSADQFLVEVKDTGIGMPPSVLNRVFNAFEQGDVSVTRRFGGLGLGLSISKVFIELHGGSIKAESEGTHRGATITMHIPTILGAEGKPTQRQSTVPELQISNLRILLVEDHEPTARVMARLLSKMGHYVTSEGTAAAAIEIAEKSTFDLLISDVGLPDGSGLDVMRHLRNHQGLKGIALSGFGMEDDITRSFEAGFEAHLTKPIELMRLTAAIQTVCGRP